MIKLRHWTKYNTIHMYQIRTLQWKVDNLCVMITLLSIIPCFSILSPSYWNSHAEYFSRLITGAFLYIGGGLPSKCQVHALLKMINVSLCIWGKAYRITTRWKTTWSQEDGERSKVKVRDLVRRGLWGFMWKIFCCKFNCLNNKSMFFYVVSL